jgi:hypothetical protein
VEIYALAWRVLAESQLLCCGAHASNDHCTLARWPALKRRVLEHCTTTTLRQHYCATMLACVVMALLCHLPCLLQYGLVHRYGTTALPDHDLTIIFTATLAQGSHRDATISSAN